MPNRKSLNNKNRQLTVCRRGRCVIDQDIVHLPEIRLSGKWLFESGFKPGQRVDIEYNNGKMTITPVNNHLIK
jgi:hypothetical protein